MADTFNNFLPVLRFSFLLKEKTTMERTER